MISALKIKHYKKLTDVDLVFSKGLNFISGTNGTCKTSLLHIISNSFQRIKQTTYNFNNPDLARILSAVSPNLNQKIETLTKSEKHYIDPAKGTAGPLFAVTYSDGKTTNFRRHNSKKPVGKTGASACKTPSVLTKNFRYAIKPAYSKGHPDTLPSLPVLYLGLSRLYPYGEYPDELPIKTGKFKLPQKYQAEVVNLYKRLTHIDAINIKQQQLTGVRTRGDFDTSINGIDANTISSGEDNLFIILTSLVLLRFYYDSLPDDYKETGSILLIDEFEATLHPTYLKKLLDLIVEYSASYRIQVIATTHSLTLLRYAFPLKSNLIYLKYSVHNTVTTLQDPNIYTIEMFLSSSCSEMVYDDRKIPIYTEDEEARDFFKMILQYYEDTNNFGNIPLIEKHLHIINANFGAEELKTLFSDNIVKSKLGEFCILDGDRDTDLSNNIISLPGRVSPERLLLQYSLDLFNGIPHNSKQFWDDPFATNSGFSFEFYADELQSDTIHLLDETQRSKRKEQKKFFHKHKDFFLLVLRHWLKDPENQCKLQPFTDNLKAVLLKTAKRHSIPMTTLLNDTATKPS